MNVLLRYHSVEVKVLVNDVMVIVGNFLAAL